MQRIVWFGYIALLAFLPFMALDISLPTFVTLTDVFHTTAGPVQQTASAYLLGMALGQVGWGPLSDTWGRRNVLAVSLLIFTLASFACAHVHTIEALWVARFIQAIGVCAPGALWQSVLVDRLETAQRDVYFAWIFPITALSPIIMPFIGAILLAWVNYQATFYATAMVGLVLLMMTSGWFAETLPLEKRHPLAWGVYFRHAVDIMTCPVFLGNTGLICFSSASFYVFLTQFPFTVDKLGMPESWMGPLIIPQTVFFMLGGLVSPWLSRHMGGKTRALLGVSCIAIVGSLILCVSVIVYPVAHMAQILAPYSITAFANGAIYPLAFSLIFESHDDKSGSAAGWVAFYLALTGFVGAFCMGLMSRWAETGMALLILVCYGLCVVSWWVCARFSEKHAT